MEYATKMQQYPNRPVRRTHRTAVSASIFGGAVYDSDVGVSETPITPVIVPEGQPIDRAMVVGTVAAPAPPIASDPRVAVDHAISIRAPRPEHATVFTGDRHFFGPYGSSIFGGGISGVGDAAMDAMAAGQAAGAAAAAAAGAAARQRAMLAKRAAMMAARAAGAPMTHRVGGRMSIVQAAHGLGAIPPPHTAAADVLYAAASAARAAAPMGPAAQRAAATSAAQAAAAQYVAAGRESKAALALARSGRRAPHGIGALPTSGQATAMIYGASNAAAAGAAAGAAAAAQRAGKTPAEVNAAAQTAGNTEYTRQAGIQSAAIQAQVDAALKALAAVKASPDIATTATDMSIPGTAKALTETPSNTPIIVAALIGVAAIGGVIYMKTRKRGAAAAAK
jgi:hypothetical protein